MAPAPREDGKRHDVPAHHRAAEALDEAAGLEEPKATLFQKRGASGPPADRPGAAAARRPGNDQAWPRGALVVALPALVAPADARGVTEKHQVGCPGGPSKSPATRWSAAASSGRGCGSTVSRVSVRRMQRQRLVTPWPTTPRQRQSGTPSNTACVLFCEISKNWAGTPAGQLRDPILKIPAGHPRKKGARPAPRQEGTGHRPRKRRGDD